MIDTCGEEQKKVFPIRMKVWLDKVLHILVINIDYSNNSLYNFI